MKYIKSGELAIFKDESLSKFDGITAIKKTHSTKIFFIKDIEHLECECEGELINGQLIKNGESPLIEETELTLVTSKYMNNRNLQNSYKEAFKNNLMVSKTSGNIIIQKVEDVDGEYKVTKEETIQKAMSATYFTKKEFEEAISENDKNVNKILKEMRGE